MLGEREALEREANKEGLKINESKTKYMIAAENTRERFETLGRAWLLATKISKSSKNLCSGVKVLRTVFSPKLGNVVYRRRYNFEL
jgi:hypothetical protein